MAPEPSVMVIIDVPEPGASMDAGRKLTLTFFGTLVADKAIVELNPFSTIVTIGELPELRLGRVIAAGVALMEKSAAAAGLAVEPTSALIRPAPFMLPQPVARL